MANHRKPTAALRAAGSWRARERADEPQLDVSVPEYCRDLTPRALEFWGELVPVLQKMRVLTEADGKALSRYCQLLARYWECERVMAVNGMVEEEPITNKAGDVVGYKRRETDECRIATALGPQLQKLEEQFGLTPVGRSRITVPNKTDENKNKRRFFSEAG